MWRIQAAIREVKVWAHHFLGFVVLVRAGHVPCYHSCYLVHTVWWRYRIHKDGLWVKIYEHFRKHYYYRLNRRKSGVGTCACTFVVFLFLHTSTADGVCHQECAPARLWLADAGWHCEFCGGGQWCVCLPESSVLARGALIYWCQSKDDPDPWGFERGPPLSVASSHHSNLTKTLSVVWAPKPDMFFFSSTSLNTQAISWLWNENISHSNSEYAG